MDKVRKNIFISHYGGDESYIEKFKKLISSDIYVYDSSVVETEPNNATNEEYIKYGILAPKIDWAGTVVVLISDKTKEREYIQWEIKYAVQNDKRIVGVYLPGASEDDVPEILQKYGDALVPWDRQKIVDAIEGDNRWETSAGVSRIASMTREEC